MHDRSQTENTERQDLEPDDGWLAPSPTGAIRRISARSRGSARPVFVTPDNREMRAESKLEADAAHILLQRPDVVSVREQAVRIRYADAAGRWAHHVPDFLVTLSTGERIAVLVKPAEKAKRQRTSELVDRLAASVSPDLADRVILLTETEITPERTRTARLLRRARARPDPEHDSAVLALGSTVNGPVSLRTLAGLTPLSGGEAFDACVRLIADGRLLRVGAGRITPQTLVSFPGAGDTAS